jgi:hypothetical protein
MACCRRIASSARPSRSSDRLAIGAQLEGAVGDPVVLGEYDHLPLDRVAGGVEQFGTVAVGLADRMGVEDGVGGRPVCRGVGGAFLSERVVDHGGYCAADSSMRCGWRGEHI